MSVIAAQIYRNGARVREADLNEPKSLDLADDEFIWVGLVDAKPDELHILEKRFKLHPLAIEDALNATQMPKIDVYGNQIFVVAKTAHLEVGTICYGETDFFVGHSHIITVRHGSVRTYSALREHLEMAPVHLRHGVDYILHAILDFIVDGYLPIIEALEDEGVAMERTALDSFLTRDQTTRIFHLRRELMRFRRVLDAMESVAGRLEHHELPAIDVETRPYFRDVLDHIHRVSALAEGLRDVLSSVFEVSMLLEQQRQGDITKRLAAWAAILAVPTAIAGIYGMNFDVMPELRFEYGYPVVLGVIVIVCMLLYRQFKRVKWL